MITGELKAHVDRLWATLWSNGIANPLTAIEQLSYLIFMRRLEPLLGPPDLEGLGSGAELPLLPPGLELPPRLRFSALRRQSDPDALLANLQEAFAWLQHAPALAETPFGRHMRGATLLLSCGPFLADVLEKVDTLFALAQRRAFSPSPTGPGTDLQGDVYEYMLSRLSTSGANGQFRTPRHLIQLMVTMCAPTLEDSICDPSSGTAGFLVGAAEYLQEHFGEALSQNPSLHRHFCGPQFTGFDFDASLMRIGAMNLLLHGIDHPTLRQSDALAGHPELSSRFSLILANPPFKGSSDLRRVAPALLERLQLPKPPPESAPPHPPRKAPGARTELLFVARVLEALRPGGRAAVIVPEGVLFGRSRAHLTLRRALVEEQRLEGVISLPSGVFKPYASVSTAILLFTRTDAGGTEEVFFFDLLADGFSLDDKRQPVTQNDIPALLEAWKTRRLRPPRDRSGQAFCVSRAELAAAQYELSLQRYRQPRFSASPATSSQELLRALLALEEEIAAGLKALLNAPDLAKDVTPGHPLDTPPVGAEADIPAGQPGGCPE